MFPVTITINTPAQLNAVLNAMAQDAPNIELSPPAPKVEAPAPKVEAPAPKVEAPAPTPAAEPQAPEPPPPVIEYAQVGAAITAFAAKHGRQAAVDKLAGLGVKSGKELKPEQYADALAAFGSQA